jgi:hypothetical protein
MDNFAHYFTVEEANQLLLELIPLVEEMITAKDNLLALQPELQETLELAVRNGNSRVTSEALGAMQSLKDVLGTIQAYGVEVKDVNRGLLDFPSKRGGEIVYLCWIYGEKSIGYWHTLEAGFAGRRAIDG